MGKTSELSSKTRKRSTLARGEPSSSPLPKRPASHSQSEFLKSWFENPEWSDLTIELKCGRRLSVHKSVLCSRNEYFVDNNPSRAADRKRKVIKLGDDDEDAVWVVIRNITDWDLPEHLDWQWWFVLIHFAAKSNEPVLATMAEDNVLQWAMMARSQGRIDVVCDVLGNLHEIDSRPQVPFKISQVAKMMQCYACDNEPFRACLYRHPDIMMELFVARAPRRRARSEMAI